MGLWSYGAMELWSYGAMGLWGYQRCRSASSAVASWMAGVSSPNQDLGLSSRHVMARTSSKPFIASRAPVRLIAPACARRVR